MLNTLILIAISAVIVLIIVFFYQLLARMRGAPVVIAHDETMKKALTLLALKAGDTLYDLGSGNGKVLFYAEKTYSVKTIGIEAAFLLVLYTKVVGFFKKSKTHFIHGDFTKMTLPVKPDAIYLFLMKPILLKMDHVFDALPSGTKIVSPVFEIKHPRIVEKEKVKDDLFSKGQFIYLYEVK
ncbi:MAG: hypothetical protein ACK4NC_03650 [Candidatus Gracilibacteria bacterium]